MSIDKGSSYILGEKSSNISKKKIHETYCCVKNLNIYKDLKLSAKG